VASLPSPASEHTLRRLAAEDAAGVAGLVRRVYGERYPRGELYSAEAIVRLDREGRWLCAVALDAGGAVVGFLALERAETGPVAELSMGVVSPEHRGERLTERLRDLLLEEGRAAGLSGQFVELGTLDTTAQVIAERAPVVPCGLTLSLWPDFARPRAQTGPPRPRRLSFLRCFRYLRAPEPATVHVPARHRDIVARVLSRLGRDPIFGQGGAADGAGDISVRAHAQLRSQTLVVERIGSNTISQLHELTEAFRRDADMESAHLDLSLADPGAVALWQRAEELGYFFGSVTPGAFGAGDGLRLQLLKSDPELGLLRLVHPFARELLAHISGEIARVADGPRRTR
jgi:GNAT superfamily N-acetyltransferase